MRQIKEIKAPVAHERTEFYALYTSNAYGGVSYHGPYRSQGQMEECLPLGEFIIVTKIKKIAVTSKEREVIT